MARDWEKEFKYLEAKHVIPSHDDLLASLSSERGLGWVPHEAVIALTIVAFRRIAQIEEDIALLARRLP